MFMVTSEKRSELRRSGIRFHILMPLLRSSLSSLLVTINIGLLRSQATESVPFGDSC
jgi:hypothetical protein